MNCCTYQCDGSPGCVAGQDRPCRLVPTVTHDADGVTVTEWHGPITANSDGSDPQTSKPGCLSRLTNFFKSL